MPRARIERKAPADPTDAIRRAASWLTALGYTTEPVAYGSAQFGWTKGAADSARLDERPHTLRILHEPPKLVFEFSTGLGSSGAVTAGEQQALEDRVDAALRAGPDGASKVGCRFCGQITDSAAPSCEGCGSVDFL
jgi:hypothetical protein